MKFKVGDKVRVVKDRSEGYYIGNVFNILAIINGDHVKEFYGDEEKSYTSFWESELELVEEANVSSGGSLRYNKGKPEFSHLSPDFILEMMKGMTAANEKYSYLNYTMKQNVRTAADSLMRHFLKFQQGQDVDDELNTHHLALVAINAMIMYQNLLDFGDEVDNRYSKAKEKVQNE